MSTKLLVKAILEKARAYKWSIQGFGMLRLYLSAEVRLHVWDSRFRVPGVTDIHDHSWDFESEVAAGEVLQRRYLVVPNAVDGDYSWASPSSSTSAGLRQSATSRASGTSSTAARSIGRSRSTARSPS